MSGFAFILRSIPSLWVFSVCDLSKGILPYIFPPGKWHGEHFPLKIGIISFSKDRTEAVSTGTTSVINGAVVSGADFLSLHPLIKATDRKLMKTIFITQSLTLFQPAIVVVD